MNVGLAFDPLVSAPLLIAAGAIALVVALLPLISRTRGGWLRALALALAFAALANPSLTREDREPLPVVAALVLDRSPSQRFGDRTARTNAARDALVERLGRVPGLELRVVESTGDTESDGTRLFAALGATLSDVPPDRVAGAILVTDGRVHDVPAPSVLGFDAPVHAVITGVEGERDRRVVLTAIPRFGIVRQRQTVGFRVEDEGAPPGGRVAVLVRRDGEIVTRMTVTAGVAAEVQVEVAHAGPNIVEIEVSEIDREITPLNNRAALTIEGVRENLRVLLVSGEPHSGERTWRNLLKSDANVDLVHFTILRPPEKQDGTPIHELSLIAFPTRELFQQRINDFNLIIFDRYAQQGVLPLIYFENIVRYVRDGGAVLVAAGPEYAGSTSIFHSPLDAVLPAEPTGRIAEEQFRATLTDGGRRHPVTRTLPGARSDPPEWSNWFRAVEARIKTGTSVLKGPNDTPLLLLARQNEGRVALLLSDHIWLWARGFEGGGPHLDLLRRLSHWLMREPDLEEERLLLLARGRELVVERRTMQDSAAPVTVTTPSGATRSVRPVEQEPGVFRAVTEADEIGLWRASDGTLSALLNVGPINPREFTRVTSTKDVLAPIAQATGGGVWRIADLGQPAPRVIPVRSGERFAGPDWLGLRMRDASVVRGVGLFPLFAGFSGLLILLAGVAATWAREGR